jgi:hypothetical protein
MRCAIIPTYYVNKIRVNQTKKNYRPRCSVLLRSSPKSRSLCKISNETFCFSSSGSSLLLFASRANTLRSFFTLKRPTQNRNQKSQITATIRDCLQMESQAHETLWIEHTASMSSTGSAAMRIWIDSSTHFTCSFEYLSSVVVTTEANAI